MTIGRRVLVCGGRKYSNRKRLFRVLDAGHAANPIGVLISGKAPGADTLAIEWADERGVPVDPYPADWTRLGLAAGPIRNQQMLDEGKPDVVVAFPGHTGTADMIARARKAGVRVVEVK